MDENKIVEITAEKMGQPVITQPVSMFGGTHKILITETRKDEAGNEYQYTRVERISVDALNDQKTNLQKQIDLIDEKIAKIEKAK